MSIASDKLDLWISKEYNVLFTGLHGVGKTAIVKEAFERNNLKWKYFSAATLDPWVDLVGVPKEVTDEDGVQYLDLVRPKEFQYDEVEALFFDELNRSPKKVRNAVMELLQFKSINGKKFNNLKIIWAAVNPYTEEEEYDVEKLDPAQEDRFQIQIEIPYRPHRKYFANKYGDELSLSFLSWWNELPQDQKLLVSPRRLDYAVDVFVNNGDLRDVLPKSTNVSKLIQSIKYGPLGEMIKKIYENKDTDGLLKVISDINMVNCIIDFISVGSNSTKNKRYDFFVPHLPSESISSMMAKDDKFVKYIVQHISDNVKQDGYDDGSPIFAFSEHASLYSSICNSIVNAKTNRQLINKIKRFARDTNAFSIIFPEKANVKNNIVLGSNYVPYNHTPRISSDISMVSNNAFTYVYTISDKKNVVNILLDYMPSSMSISDTSRIASLMDNILRSSQSTTILQHSIWIDVFNFTVSHLHKLTGMSTIDMGKVQINNKLNPHYLRIYNPSASKMKILNTKGIGDKIICIP